MNDRWLGALFWMSEKLPRLMRWTATPVNYVVWAVAPTIRAAVLDNFKHLLPAETNVADRQRMGRKVVAQFIRFVADLGVAQRQTPEQLVARVSEVVGNENIERASAMGRGLIIATAHLGSFEVGLAMTAAESSAVHVVFATDPFPRFERMRTRLREKLGVHEARAVGGWGMWADLRDALARGEVVVLQGDRVMPGQKGMSVPMLGAPASLPTGPARLAQITSAPILPVFAVRQRGNRIRIIIDEPVLVDETDDPRGAQRIAVEKLAETIGRRVAEYPDQWLMLHRVWGDEDDAMDGTMEEKKGDST